MKLLVESLAEAVRKKRISIDAVMTFERHGKKVVAKVKKTHFVGGSKMTYTWKTLDGGEFQTHGVPPDAEVLADVPRGFRT